MLQYQKDWLVFGSAVTLTLIIDANPFPLLTETCRHVADHTNRNKITLGGNLCGRIKYHEALLPFLLLDARVLTLSENGYRRASIHDIFQEEMTLSPGELFVQIAVNRNDTNAPYAFTRRTKLEKVDYPLVTIAAIKRDNRIRAAFSGVCAFPFRSQEIEDVLNSHGLPPEERVNRSLQLLPAEILDDILGSREYRTFVLQDLLMEILATLEGV
jgi:aerobic carbon-monoxide dehydrogenase medium subunit